MAKLRYSGAAKSNLESIATYIAEQSGSRDVAQRFIRRLGQKCRDLARAPIMMGRPRPELRLDLRSHVIGHYVIFFRYVGETLEIVNILEGHRDMSAFFQGDERSSSYRKAAFVADCCKMESRMSRLKRCNIACLRWGWLPLWLALTGACSPLAAADVVKIGIARTISDVGYYIADAKGFFREEGLQVSINGFASAAQMVAPLGTGELDVGGGTVSAGFYNAVGRGILMKIVADQASIKPGYGFSSLMVRKDLVDGGRYKTYADLKGMKVAVGAPGTGSASALNHALKQGGLTFNDVEVVYIGFPEHLAAYRNKGIDASITNEPTMTRAIEAGVAVRVAGNDVIYPGQQTAVAFYSDYLIRNRRDVGERFMRAYLRGVRVYNDALKDGRIAGPNAEEVIAVLVQYTAIKDAGMFRRIVPSWVDPDGDVSTASLASDLDFFRQLGLIEKKDITVEAVVDGSFAKAAVAKLGPYRRAEPSGARP